MESITSELLDLWDSILIHNNGNVMYIPKLQKKKNRKKKRQQKMCYFLYNLISIANGKLSLLIQEYP